MSRRSRKHRSRPGHRTGRRQLPWKMIAGGVTLAAILGGTGYLIARDAGFAKPDVEGCYATSDGNAHTVAIVDSSEPRFDPAQTRDLMTSFRQLLASGLSFGERFSIVTTEQARIGSVPDPVMSFCRSAKSAHDLELVEAATASQAYLIKQAEMFAEKTFEPTMAEIFDANPDDGHRQRHESPILEQVQGVARMADFSNQTANRSLILVSDLIQTTQEAQFCQTQGHLPDFETFKQGEYYQRIKPNSLDGVDVKIYMLLRGGYGGEHRPYCSEDELRNFWHDYFIDAGASNVDVIRLRQGQ